MAKGSGTKASPWVLTTPSGSSEYHMYKDEAAKAAVDHNPKNDRMRAK